MSIPNDNIEYCPYGCGQMLCGRMLTDKLVSADLFYCPKCNLKIEIPNNPLEIKQDIGIIEFLIKTDSDSIPDNPQIKRYEKHLELLEKALKRKRWN